MTLSWEARERRSCFMGVAPLPTGASNATEIAARSIDLAGTHIGQVCGSTCCMVDVVLTNLFIEIVDLLYAQ
jgi:hypothetical protein